MKKIIVLVALLHTSFSHGAGPENLTPTFVGCFPNGTCYIGVAPASTTSTCPIKNQIRFDISLPGSKAQYSAALAAMMADKTINANLTDICIDGYSVPDWVHANKK